MEKIFSIEKAAKAVGTTAETLRHYDRIGLVKPCKTDEWTGYRYYSERELVRLNTVRALRCMDLSLKEIKEILELDDFEKIISLLKQTERKADQKMKELTDAKCKIQRARQFYEGKRTNQAQRESAFVQTFPERVILLSDRLTEPTLDNLWDYHRHFYAQVGEEKKKDFSLKISPEFTNRKAARTYCFMYAFYARRRAAVFAAWRLSLSRLYGENAPSGNRRNKAHGGSRICR